jgi:tetratricopeptide (TPR) repeat protein
VREESDIFFGREKHTDQLLEKLGNTHFVAVTGLSGCGKSSLVRTGLVTGLEAGFLSNAGANWRIAVIRPGNCPFERLTERLLDNTVLGNEYFEYLTACIPEHEKNDPELNDLCHSKLLSQLKIGDLSLYEVVINIELPKDIRLLVVVDQFEELFRYYRLGSKNEARGFVGLLLGASKHSNIYVVITMRSDFLGECVLFHGLPEAINSGLYLTPQMTREQLREAIECPAKVFGGEIKPELVNDLLNDIGNNHDRLPVLQHALARMWDIARSQSEESVTLTREHYNNIGKTENALSNHADEVYESLNDSQKEIAKIMFGSLVEYESNQTDTRRPVQISEIAEIANADWQEVAEVAEVFCQKGRNFLTSNTKENLKETSVLDISHESLIRLWKKLTAWVKNERESVELYRRLKDAAVRKEKFNGEFWYGIDLEIGLKWKQNPKHNPRWAKRYGKHYDKIIAFLRESETQQKINKERLNSLFELALDIVNTLMYILVDELKKIPGKLPVISRILKTNIPSLDKMYELYPDTKVSLREKGSNLSRIGNIWLILDKTENALKAYQQDLEISKKLTEADPANSHAQRDLSISHEKLGKIHLQLGDTQAALKAYQQALEISKKLAESNSANSQAQQDLSYSYQRLGNVHLQLGDTQAALKAYQQALEIRKKLAESDTSNNDAQHDLFVSYSKIGRVYEILNQSESAFDAQQNGLLIAQKNEKRHKRLQNDISEFKGVIDRLKGDEYMRQNKPDSAIELYIKALEISKQLTEERNDNLDARYDLHINYRKLGQAHEAKKRFSEASECFKKALGIVSRIAKDENNKLAQNEEKLLISLIEGLGPKK